MRSLLSFIVIFGVFASLAAFSKLNPSGVPAPVSSASPSPVSSTPIIEPIASPSAEASGAAAPLPPVTTAEAAKLRKQFKRALKDQLKNLDDSQRRIRKESHAARKRRFDEWSKEQNQARRKFFETNMGAARREYMKDLIRRREAFLSASSDEEKREKEEHAIRKSALESDQATRLREFESYLKNGQRPPESVWPQ